MVWANGVSLYDWQHQYDRSSGCHKRIECYGFSVPSQNPTLLAWSASMSVKTVVMMSCHFASIGEVSQGNVMLMDFQKAEFLIVCQEVCQEYVQTKKCGPVTLLDVFVH